MNPSNDTGATEFLANLSVGTIVGIALIMTILRLLLLRFSGTQRSGDGVENPFSRGVAEVLESLIVAGVLVFLLIRPFFVQAYFIPSESMENTLLGHEAGTNFQTQISHTDSVHDRLFVNKLVYRYSHPQRGDIVVFRAPASADNEHHPPIENTLIKRCIGSGGDTIEVKQDGVYRNGELLKEPYIKEPMRGDLMGQFKFGTLETTGPIKLAPDELWMMGDNRNNSNDSRYWGPLKRERAIGKAEVIFLPLNRIRMLH